MKRGMTWVAVTLLVVSAILLSFTGASALSNRPPQEASKEKAEYTLTVLNPQGSVKIEKNLARRLDTLNGKKVAMWLSATSEQIYAGKGADLYDLLEKMLKEKYPDIRIVRYTDLPMKYAPEKEVVDAIVATGPDAVVAGFGG